MSLNLYNQNLLEDNSIEQFLSFSVGKNTYALATKNVVEILKLPKLDYPQKLPNNIIGLLNYNSLSIKVIDIRFYLDIEIEKYTLSNQLLIVKTDEAFLGLVINKVEDIISINQKQTENFDFSKQEKIIDFLYRTDENTISGLNIYAIENLLKSDPQETNIDIPSLFPQDDDSQLKMVQRTNALREKAKQDLSKNLFTQDKFISFALDKNKYCINLNAVKEFLKEITLTPVPGMPDYIVGLTNLRGDFITIVELKKVILETENSPPQSKEKQRVIILNYENYKIGFLVDEIFGIVEISEETINQHKKKSPNNFISSEVILEDEFISILDLKNIIDDDRLFIEEN